MATALLSNSIICKMNVTPLLHNSKSFTNFHKKKKVKKKKPTSAWFHMLTCSCQIQLLAHQKEFISVDSSGVSLVDTTVCHWVKQQHCWLIESKAKGIPSPETISSLLHYLFFPSAALQSPAPPERTVLALALLMFHSPRALPHPLSWRAWRGMPTTLMSISLAYLWWREYPGVHWGQMGPSMHQTSSGSPLWTKRSRPSGMSQCGQNRACRRREGAPSPTSLSSQTTEPWGRVTAKFQQADWGLTQEGFQSSRGDHWTAHPVWRQLRRAQQSALDRLLALLSASHAAWGTCIRHGLRTLIRRKDK